MKMMVLQSSTPSAWLGSKTGKTLSEENPTVRIENLEIISVQCL